jgi:FAS-associated factor 2
MTLLTRIEGPVTTAQLKSTLTSAVTRTRATLTRRRALKQEQASARELRRMQEEAYTNSLAADRAKQESERLATENSARLALEREEKLVQQQHKAENREMWRQWKAADLRKKGLVGLRSEIGKTARVGVRLLGGERIVQMFPGELALEEVYSFVECYDLLLPQRDEGMTLRNSQEAEEEIMKPQGYEHGFEFRLVVPYPRKVIDSGLGAVKNEAALWPSGSIVVEEVEEGDSEEDESESDDE